jgi:glycosyltransferase involved in cell wall biosynthesis
MKILLINKFAYAKGGAERHVLALQRLLESHGHTVIVFSMHHPQNPPRAEDRYFVSSVDFERVQFGWQGLRAAGRMLYSFEARRKLRELLRKERPDVAHCHNIYHQLSPSILCELRSQNIPVVMTLHDFKLLSPTYNLYAHHGLCTHALGGRWYECLLHRCTKRSVVASGLEVCEMTFHKALKIYEKNVNVFLAPSAFLRDMVRQYDPHVRDIRLLPNFIALGPPPDARAGSFFLYAGRLSEEKGVQDLLAASRSVAFPVKIAGDGPLKSELDGVIRQEHCDHVELLGQCDESELRSLFSESRAVILPSRCYENSPLAVLEAFRAGKPAIVADHGGMRELIEDDRTGIRFTPGSVDSLHAAMRRLAERPDDATRMGKHAWAAAQRFDEKRYYHELMRIYESLQKRA